MPASRPSSAAAASTRRVDRTGRSIHNRRVDVPERFEQLIAYLNSQLPSPVDQQTTDEGSLQFIGGDPPEVVVLLTDTSIVVSEFAGVWKTPFEFAAKPRRVGVLKWRRLPENALLGALDHLVRGAREARRASYQVCQYCGRSTAPEWLHDNGVCQSCADQHSGAIH
jgi:hypothetical protein